MKLAGHEPGVPGYLDDLDQGQPVGEFSRNQTTTPLVAMSPRSTGYTVAWPDGGLEFFDADGNRIDFRNLDSQVVKLLYTRQGDRVFVATRFEVLTFDTRSGNQLGSSIPVTLKPLRGIFDGERCYI